MNFQFYGLVTSELKVIGCGGWKDRRRWAFIGSLQMVWLTAIVLVGTANAQVTTFGAPVQLGTDRFKFPRNAHDIAPDLGGSPQCVALRIMFPGMEGRTAANWREMSLPSRKSRVLQLLLCDRGHADLPVTAQLSPNAAVERVAVTHISGRPLKLIDLLPELVATEEMGLTRLELNEHARTKPQYKTAQLVRKYNYVELRNSKILTYVGCRSTSQKNPSCGLYFPFRSIVVKAEFRNSYLHEWRNIRHMLKDYLEKHRVENSLH